MKLATGNRQKAVSLPVFLGRRVRWFRERAGLRQDEVAAVARRWGFDWTQATVATVEAGRRRLSCEESVLLPWIVANQGPETAKRGTAAPIELPDLFPSSIGDYVRINRRLLVDASSLGDIYRGHAKGRGLNFVDLPASGDTVSENEAVLDCLWPGERQRDRGKGGPIRDILVAAHVDKLADAEQKAARRLRTFPLAVAAAARKRWGRSFSEERDHRVNADLPEGAAARTRQARRGHVTRALLDELRLEGIEGLRPRKAKRVGR